MKSTFISKRSIGTLLGFILCVTLLSVVVLLCAPPAQAATPNYSIAVPGVQIIPLQIEGQRTASVTAVSKFKLPFPARVIGVSATARASGGTDPTLTVDIKEGATSILSAPVSITAGTVAEATISDAVIADEAVMSVDLAIGGTTPTWDDITVLLTVVRQ